ncbi:hypothetical protein [Corynebacterium sp. MSK158]|uniref:hypothetical protein n=1 Tax=Corynebacterium sp. MSK158 TaxID=3050212 RepID=UPI00254EEC95|nr:hypothetical protein [Corynebacterium sp. MSK158]MDK8694443.1 hypothetical protein [Corynebacterium sp. MSK158]
MAENVDKPTIDGVPLPVRDLALEGRANAEAGVSVAEINASMGSNYEESITVSEGCDRDLPRENDWLCTLLETLFSLKREG